MTRLPLLAFVAVTLAACGSRDSGPVLMEVTPQGNAAVMAAP
jgi:hypothetical protein